MNNPRYESESLSVMAKWMNSFHVYGFTLVSGYLFYYSKYEKGKYSDFRLFAENKVKRLLIPYLFVLVVWVIPFAVYCFEYSVTDIFIKYVLGASPNQLWFLLMLFGVFLIFYPLSNFFLKYDVKGAILVILLYGIGTIGQLLFPNVFQVFRICIFMSFFGLGFKIRQYGSLWLRKIPAIVWLVADVLLLAVVQILSDFNGVIFTLLSLGFDFILHIIGAMMAFVVLQKTADRIKWKESKAFGFLSKNSMLVYLFHQQVIYIFIAFLNGLINPYLHAGVNFIGAMVVSLMISVILMKFKWTRILTGEK